MGRACGPRLPQRDDLDRCPPGKLAKSGYVSAAVLREAGWWPCMEKGIHHVLRRPNPRLNPR